jgi:hypothetical protein
MDEIIKTLVKIADQLDLKGKADLAALVDETIKSLGSKGLWNVIEYIDPDGSEGVMKLPRNVDKETAEMELKRLKEENPNKDFGLYSIDAERKQIERDWELGRNIYRNAARPKSSKPLKKMEDKTKDELFKFLSTACKNTEETVNAIEELMRRLRYFGVDGDVKSLKLDITLKDAKELNHVLSASAHKLHELAFGRKMPKGAKKEINSDHEENINNPTHEEMDEFWGGKEPAFEDDANDEFEKTTPDFKMPRKVMIDIFEDRVATLDSGKVYPREQSFIDNSEITKIGPKAWWCSFDDADTGRHTGTGFFGPYKNREEAKLGGEEEAEKRGFKVVTYEESNYGKENG